MIFHLITLIHTMLQLERLYDNDNVHIMSTYSNVIVNCDVFTIRKKNSVQKVKKMTQLL